MKPTIFQKKETGFLVWPTAKQPLSKGGFTLKSIV
jgi:hypothetical protein